MLVYVEDCKQALRLGLLSQEFINKYGEQAINSFLYSTSDRYLEDEIVVAEGSLSIEKDYEHLVKIYKDKLNL